jgi:predicted metal-dependent hydrolase
VSKKSEKIAALIASCRGQKLDARYLGFFQCFNRGLYFEAHDVLEELWLAERRGPDGDFYKGLIQLAGAFVHLQKGRLQPAAALFKLAQSNLGRYGDKHCQLDVRAVLGFVAVWLRDLEQGQFKHNPLTPDRRPEIGLCPAEEQSQ